MSTDPPLREQDVGRGANGATAGDVAHGQRPEIGQPLPDNGHGHFDPPALAYFAEHAIDPAVAGAVGVRQEGDTLAFEYVAPDGSRFARLRSLNGGPNGGPKVRQPKGVSLTLWAARPAADGKDAALLCEGESDALAALGALRGSPLPDMRDLAVYAIPGAMPADRTVAELAGAGVRQVWVALDADEAGRAHRDRLAPLLLAGGIRPFLVELPDGKDLADVLAAIPSPDRGEWLANALLDAEAAAEAERSHSGVADEAAIRFLSPDELRASAPAEPPWRWHGYLAAGAVTVLAGRPKSGKSTLALAVAHALAARAPAFLGHAIDGCRVVYVSEEGASTLAHKVPDAELRIATRETAWPRPTWPALLNAAAAEAERVAAKVVVLDTFAFWAGLPPDAEKDAGAMQRAMEPLVALARSGLAVLLVHHARKGGGEDGDAVRGSNALAGAADIVLELDRVDSDSPRQRRLLALSRYPQTPGALVISHHPAEGSWAVLGEGTDRGDARDIANRGVLLDALEYDEDVTRAELEEATRKPSREWHGTLEQLIEDGQAVKAGAGKKGDPFRYRKLREPSAQHPRRNGPAPGADSAAHPVGVQHPHHDAAPPDDSAGCAETDEDLERWSTMVEEAE